MFAIASVTTAVLSLDATVVLLTPVVFATAARLDLRARPDVYACTHLANSASLLLPVSNLTNLLAFAASGLAFPRFAALMALPWLAAIGVEYAVFGRFFAADLGVGAADPEREQDPSEGVPVFTIIVVAVTLAGFVATSAAGVSPAWAAFGGAAVLAARGLARRRVGPVDLVRAADPPFLLFVLGLAIVVAAVVGNGLGSALRPLLPTGASLPALLAIAALAAVLANVANNLPAVLVLAAAGRAVRRRSRPRRADRRQHRAEPHLHRLAGDPAVAPQPAQPRVGAGSRGIHQAGPAHGAGRTRRRGACPVGGAARQLGRHGMAADPR